MIPEALEALERGVLFDVGHGTASFSYRTITRFKERYSCPFTISTDIYIDNYVKPVGSLMKTMSKLLSIGYSLNDVVKSVTSRAAKAIGLAEQGTLKLGTRADLTIFTIAEREEDLVDSEGEIMKVRRVLQPRMTVKDGEVVYSE